MGPGLDLKQQAEILKQAGFRDTVRQLEHSADKIRDLKLSISKFPPPQANFATALLGSTAEGLATSDRYWDIEYATIVDEEEDCKAADCWTQDLSKYLRQQGFPVQKDRQGSDALNQPFESFEGHAHFRGQFTRTETSKPRLEVMYKANLVSILSLSYPLIENPQGFLLAQRLKILQYIEDTRKNEKITYLYSHLTQEPYTQNRNDTLKMLKLERIGLTKAILGLHFAFFGTKCVNEFKTPPTLACEIADELPKEHKKGFLEASIKCFDGYFKLRQIIVEKGDASPEFTSVVHQFLPAEQTIRDFSLEYARRRGWATTRLLEQKAKTSKNP